MPNPPLPHPASSASTPLEAELIGRIRGHGPLPFGGYMARCLYDPYFGYYTRGINFTGPQAGRDFLTAPTLTPLFGATLAGWVVAEWHRLGTPTPFTLLEAGPGNGTLMHSLWHALPNDVRTAARPHLVESSPTLTHIQQKTLAGIPARWSDSLGALSPSRPIICIANELLDAFPTDLFKHENNQWHQRVVTLTPSGELTLDWHPARRPPPLPAGWIPGNNALLEVSDTQHKWLHQLAGLLKQTTGSALLIDYGYTTLPPHGGETLQALHHHTAVPLLHRPGESDLTAHVNFTECSRTLGHTSTVTDLTPFLLSHKLLQQAEPSIASPATQAALHRLLHPGQMGTLFKVLEFRA